MRDWMFVFWRVFPLPVRTLRAAWHWVSEVVPAVIRNIPGVLAVLAGFSARFVLGWLAGLGASVQRFRVAGPVLTGATVSLLYAPDGALEPKQWAPAFGFLFAASLWVETMIAPPFYDHLKKSLAPRMYPPAIGATPMRSLVFLTCAFPLVLGAAVAHNQVLPRLSSRVAVLFNCIAIALSLMGALGHVHGQWRLSEPKRP